MYEPWVRSIDLSTVEVDTVSDPDHPNVPKLTNQSTKQARTGVAMIKIIQLEQECLRRLFANYLGDVASDGMCLYLICSCALILYETAAFHFTAKWCCNRHPGTNFRWSHFFQGQLLYQDPENSTLYYGDVHDPDWEEIVLPLRNKRKGAAKARAAKERKLLIDKLRDWRAGAHARDPLAFVRHPSLIIDDGGIKLLARLHPSNVTQSEQVVSALGQTQEWRDEWSSQVFDVIRSYDHELAARRKAEAARSKSRQKRVKREKDQVKFTEVSNEIEERIRREVLSRHAAATLKIAQTRTGLEDRENAPLL